MSEIRELAMRLAGESNNPELRRIAACGAGIIGPYDVEFLVRAAMREGMMRAAEIAEKTYVKSAVLFELGTAAGIAIRAEADKLEGKP